jgi:sec-independent protein translocase protein TatB
MIFDFSTSEIIMVMVVALIVIGPKEIPKAMRALGQIVAKLRRTADEFRRYFDETVREAGGEELQRDLNHLRHHNPISEIRNTIEDAARDAINPASLRIDEPLSNGQQNAGTQTPAEGATASPTSAPTSSSAPKQATDATPSKQTKAVEREVSGKDAELNTPAPIDSGDPVNSDKPPLK